MRRPRFVVRTCCGYRIGANQTARRGGSQQVGVSAYVMDAGDGFRVLTTYRSEDRSGERDAGGRLLPGQSRGVLGALQAAEAEASRLNAEAVS